MNTHMKQIILPAHNLTSWYYYGEECLILLTHFATYLVVDEECLVPVLLVDAVATPLHLRPEHARPRIERTDALHCVLGDRPNAPPSIVKANPA